MSKRLLSTTFLLCALMFAQGGSFLIGALCPHVRTGVMRCDTSAQTLAEEPVMDHDHVADMQMDHDSGSLQFDPETAAFRLRTGTCEHCAVHARATSNDFSVRHVEPTKRATNPAVATPFEEPKAAMIQTKEQLTARSHSPPGGSISKNILSDGFRI